MSAVYIAIAIAAALLGADRVLKYLSRTGKLRLESKYLRLTHQSTADILTLKPVDLLKELNAM